MKNFSYIFVLFILLTSFVVGQEVNVGVGLQSKYVWRGLEFSKAPVVQPDFNVAYAGFKLGTWGSYSLADLDNSNFDQINFYLNYTLNTKAGDFTLGVTDNTFPGNGIPLGNFANYNDDKAPGAHLVEASLLWNNGVFDLQYNVDVWGDSSYTMYMEAGITFGNANTGTVRPFLGVTPGSDYNLFFDYNSKEFAVVNVGVTASKKLGNVPVTASWVLNPRKEVSYLIFGIYF